MRILFVLGHAGYVRNYESALRTILDRGDHVDLVFTRRDKREDGKLPVQLALEYEYLAYHHAPKRTVDGWGRVGLILRGLADFSRYLHPRYAESTLLRDRVAERIGTAKRAGRLSGPLGTFVRVAGRLSSAFLSRLLTALFWRLNDAVPPSPELTKYIETFRPDVVLVTPLVDIASLEVEYARAATHLGLPLGLCVASWDNLTNKGLIHGHPDAVFVWNDVQRREAVELHGVPRDRVVVTGAQRFDQWFAKRPSTSYEDFCARAGLDPERPYVLYLCSSPFIAPDELSFVRRWLDALRGSGVPGLAEAGVLVRPHPQNAAQWERAELDDPSVSIWPRAGAQPIDEQNKADFFDSLYYCSAVVGINTSALIEAAILEKSVLTVLDPDFAGTQEGTLHFHYLLHENGGFLHVARDLDQHVVQLAEAIEGRDAMRAQTRAFVTSFVRPFGLDVEATPILADAIQELSRRGRSTRSATRWSDKLLRLPLAAIARLATGEGSKRPPSRLGRFARELDSRVLMRPAKALLRWSLRFRVVRAAALLILGDDVRPRPVNPATAKLPNPEQPAIDALRATGARLRRSRTGAVVIGPWLGSATDELLYWIPFVRWSVQRFKLEPSRNVIVSRGGVKAWYRRLGADYVDAHETIGREYGRHAEAWNAAWDDEDDRKLAAVCNDVLDACGNLGSRPSLPALCPSHLQGLLGRFRRDEGSMRHAMSHLSFASLAVPHAEKLVSTLPGSYVAIDLTPTAALPRSTANTEAIRATVQALAGDERPLVSVGPNDAIAREVLGDRLLTPLEGAKRTRRLGLHSAVIARADSVVAAFGDTAMLGVACGRPTVALVGGSRRSHSRIELAQRCATAIGTDLVVLPTDQIGLAAALGTAASEVAFEQALETLERVQRRRL